MFEVFVDHGVYPARGFGSPHVFVYGSVASPRLAALIPVYWYWYTVAATTSTLPRSDVPRNRERVARDASFDSFAFFVSFRFISFHFVLFCFLWGFPCARRDSRSGNAARRDPASTWPTTGPPEAFYSSW